MPNENIKPNEPTLTCSEVVERLHIHQRGFPCPDCDGAREFLASAASPGLGILGWPEVDANTACAFAEAYAKWKHQARALPISAKEFAKTFVLPAGVTQSDGDYLFAEAYAKAILHSWRERRVQELEELLRFAIADRDKYKAKLNNEYRAAIGEVWHWQNDECDNLESLVCPILISANDLRAIALRNVVLAEAAEALRKISGKAQDNPNWETAYCDGVFDGVEDCIDVLEELKI